MMKLFKKMGNLFLSNRLLTIKIYLSYVFLVCYMSDNKIENSVNRILRNDRDKILEIIKSGTKDLTGDTSYTYSKKVSDTYEGEQREFDFDISVVFTFMDFKKHKYEKDGQYYVEIICEVDDTQILPKIKKEFISFADDLMPHIDIVIRQNYPEGLLKFNEDMTENEFKKSFIS